jgi:hypothetical protein
LRTFIRQAKLSVGEAAGRLQVGLREP